MLAEQVGDIGVCGQPLLAGANDRLYSLFAIAIVQYRVAVVFDGHGWTESAALMARVTLSTENSFSSSSCGVFLLSGRLSQTGAMRTCTNS